MKKIKSAVALLCAVAVSLSMLVIPSSASGNLFFLSLNDTLPAQSAQTTPIQYSGWIYVPANIFSSRVTGINFGVYYGLTDNDANLVFYNLSGKTLTFDLKNGTATASSGETPVPGNVLRQNGIYYVPAYAICRYFGLSYSFYTTDYGPLLRIKDSNAVLSDSLFISSASSIMRNRANSNNQQSPNGNGSQGNGTTTPTTPGNTTTSTTTTQPNASVTPEIPEDAEPAPTFSLYMGIQASAETDITATLNALGSVGSSAVVFFPADELGQCTDQIRQAAGRGHKVGLIPAGETAAERLASVEQGSQQLAGILRQETWFVLASDKELTEAGYLCWAPSLRLTALQDATKTYNTVVKAGDSQGSALRVLVSSQSTSGVLAGVLGQLSKDGDTFLQARETRY